VGVSIWKTEVYTVVESSLSCTKNLKYSEIWCSSVFNSFKTCIECMHNLSIKKALKKSPCGLYSMQFMHTHTHTHTHTSPCVLMNIIFLLLLSLIMQSPCNAATSCQNALINAKRQTLIYYAIVAIHAGPTTTTTIIIVYDGLCIIIIIIIIICCWPISVVI